MENKIKCSVCGKEFNLFGIKGHYWRMHGAGRNHQPTLGRRPWNYKLSKETDETVRLQAEQLKERYAKGEIKAHWLGKKHSPETRAKLSKVAGGYRKGSGRGKSGWYKGHWCDSTWELAWVIYNLDHGIKFRRNTQIFEYTWKEKECSFIPDFIVEHNEIETYVEIKGIMDEKNKAKINGFRNPIIVLLKPHIEPYINYVKQKYIVKELIDLYDHSSKRLENTRKCECGNKISRKNKSGKCLKCYAEIQRARPEIRKVLRPSKQELEVQIEAGAPWVQLGKKYNVSDNSVKKWAISYNIPIPIRNEKNKLKKLGLIV